MHLPSTRARHICASSAVTRRSVEIYARTDIYRLGVRDRDGRREENMRVQERKGERERDKQKYSEQDRKYPRFLLMELHP